MRLAQADALLRSLPLRNPTLGADDADALLRSLLLVTYDRDFTDEDETTEKIRQAIPGIMLPPVFLREIMGWTSEELEERFLNIEKVMKLKNV